MRKAGPGWVKEDCQTTTADVGGVWVPSSGTPSPTPNHPCTSSAGSQSPSAHAGDNNAARSVFQNILGRACLQKENAFFEGWRAAKRVHQRERPLHSLPSPTPSPTPEFQGWCQYYACIVFTGIHDLQRKRERRGWPKRALTSLYRHPESSTTLNLYCSHTPQPCPLKNKFTSTHPHTIR